MTVEEMQAFCKQEGSERYAHFDFETIQQEYGHQSSDTYDSYFGPISEWVGIRRKSHKIILNRGGNNEKLDRGYVKREPSPACPQPSQHIYASYEQTRIIRNERS